MGLSKIYSHLWSRMYTPLPGRCSNHFDSTVSFSFEFEIARCPLLRWNYVKDWENWMEIALYVCSIVFAWVFHTECLCPFEWQWQVGVVSMFLGWITLLVFVQKFPNTGIYVLMFLSICYTFLKAVILFALLVLAFSLTFYMVFYEPQFQVSIKLSGPFLYE